MNADKYYGSEAATYDAQRCHSLRWANEQRAVADMVFSGPVIDCPLGTGRYVGIYRDKGLEVFGVDISSDMLATARRNYPWLDARPGSIFDLPFSDCIFETAVCVRLLDWLYPDDMDTAVAELRRVARTVIVSIRHGQEGEGSVNYTHSLSRFYEAIDGLFICDRRTTEISRDGTEEIFRLRPPMWSDLVRQFEYHGHTPEWEMYRLAEAWSGSFGFKPPVFSQKTMTVRAEYWNGDVLGRIIDAMAAEHDHKVDDPEERYLTEEKPRFSGGPVTVLRTQGCDIVLDGRRRINQWRKMPGRYPVLVVKA